jgi:hypothetical protein
MLPLIGRSVPEPATAFFQMQHPESESPRPRKLAEVQAFSVGMDT